MLVCNFPVWSPHLKKDISFIESVQKNFTCKVCVCYSISFISSYGVCLNQLHLKTLEFCHLANGLILICKICHSLINLAFNDYFRYHEAKYNLRQQLHMVGLSSSCLFRNFFNLKSSLLI